MLLLYQSRKPLFGRVCVQNRKNRVGATLPLRDVFVLPPVKIIKLF